MIKCEECGREMESLVPHLLSGHGLTVQDYKERYPGAPVIDSGLVARRTENRDANAAYEKTKETFARNYPEGHPLRNSAVREAQRATRELNGFSYDVDKAKATNRERYGLDFAAQSDARRETSRSLMKNLNKDRKPAVCPDPEAFKELCRRGTTRAEMRRIYGFKSDEVFKRWEDELGIPRGGAYKGRNENFPGHRRLGQ